MQSNNLFLLFQGIFMKSITNINIINFSKKCDKFEFFFCEMENNLKLQLWTLMKSVKKFVEIYSNKLNEKNQQIVVITNLEFMATFLKI